MAKKSFKIRDNLAAALGDTVSSARNNAGELHIEIIPLRKISLDQDNPRDLALSFDDLYTGLSENDKLYKRKALELATLSSLAKSITEQGVINPIVVYKQGELYKLIAGERRTLASIIAKKSDIPAKVLTSKPDQLKLSLIQWIENIEREDLSLWERIRNLDKILLAYANGENKQPSEVIPTELARLLGCSLQQGVNYCHILNASNELRKYIQSNEIKNIEKAAVIAKSPTAIQPALIQACLAGATFVELKKLSGEVSAAQIVASTKTKNPNTKVNLGSTKSTQTAKTIIDVVLSHRKFQHLSSSLGDVRWDDHRSVSVAFKQLLKLLEQI